MMKNILPNRLAVIRATLSLLYHSNPHAFMISAIVIYQDALLIILDESSASLDPVGERQILSF